MEVALVDDTSKNLGLSTDEIGLVEVRGVKFLINTLEFGVFTKLHNAVVGASQAFAKSDEATQRDCYGELVKAVDALLKAGLYGYQKGEVRYPMQEEDWTKVTLVGSGQMLFELSAAVTEHNTSDVALLAGFR